MKKAISNKPKTAKKEDKPKRKTPPAVPPRAKSPPPAKEIELTLTVPEPEPAPAPPEAVEEPTPPRRKRSADKSPAPPRAKSGRGSRAKSFGFDDDLMQDYVMDEEPAGEELEDEIAMEPIELPLELLDPELVEVPRPSSPPKPKPKPVSNRRQQVCANCRNTFAWLSVEQLCFNCLKKKLSQRKREDETYPGFTGEAEEEEESS